MNWSLLKLRIEIYFKLFVHKVFYPFRYLKYAIRHEWHCLWIRKDEFHISLEMDLQYLGYVAKSKELKQEYFRNLGVRREIAHRRSIDA